MADFLRRMTALADQGAGEAVFLREVPDALSKLVTRDTWLPPELAAPHPEHYQQYLLYCDPKARFSVVSFVWGAGQE
ncbi:MAG: cysteine dioxygenase, partial [Rhodospirillaceae bacterium]|nr:cysteine dioxygenase [Rhodospirillaceae bacterium]